MENRAQIEERSAEDKKKDIQAAKVIGGFVAVLIAGIGFYIASSPNEEKGPTPTTISEATSTTTILDQTQPETQVDPGTGDGGGVILTPENLVDPETPVNG